MLRKVVHKLTKSGGLLLAVVFAAVVGGATTAVVMAAIPSSSGTISACYKNSAGLTNPKGNLRVINSDTGDTCTSQETALNWSANGGHQIAYAEIGGSGTLNTSYSTGVTSAKFVAPAGDTDPTDPGTVCFNVSFTPKAGTNVGDPAGGADQPFVAGMSAATAANIESICGSGYNAADNRYPTDPASAYYMFFN